MKPQTYLRLLLLIPYLLWAVVLPFLQFYGESTNSSIPGGTISRLLFLLPTIYVFGILYWFVPYTLLAFGLLVWSIKRQAKTILVVFALSPLMLTALMLLEINLLSIASQEMTYSLADSNVRTLMALNLVVIIASLLVGYACVGIGIASYKIFQALDLFRESKGNIEPILKEAL